MYTDLKVDRFNTKYQIRVQTFDEDGHASDWSSTKTFTSGELKDWNWNSSERNAFNFHGKTNELTAERWVSFCGYVNSVSLAVKDLGYDTWTISDEEFRDVEEDEIMRASYFSGIFNLLNKLCEYMDVNYNYPGDDAFSRGKIIYGKYFIDAEDVLNKIIYKINNPPEEGE